MKFSVMYVFGFGSVVPRYYYSEGGRGGEGDNTVTELIDPVQKYRKYLLCVCDILIQFAQD